MKPHHIVVAGFTVLAAGCANPATDKAVQDATTRFYSQIDANDYQAIYSESAPQFRTVTPDIWSSFMKRISSKMGACEAPVKNKAVWGQTVSTGGTFVVQGYTRNCANGVLQEKLTFVVNGNKAVLLGYNANNPLLMI